MSYQKEAAVRADKANGCRITRWLHRRGSRDTFITQEIPSKGKKKKKSGLQRARLSVAAANKKL